ncbi:hypothetical protein FRB93_000836 [Tulasnella sp. JGI-2019a]|nr:hypothetical protein FRB93_000836 [Tulasnella sp. JGI-2019a]
MGAPTQTMTESGIATPHFNAPSRTSDMSKTAEGLRHDTTARSTHPQEDSFPGSAEEHVPAASHRIISARRTFMLALTLILAYSVRLSVGVVATASPRSVTAAIGEIEWLVSITMIPAVGGEAVMWKGKPATTWVDAIGAMLPPSPSGASHATSFEAGATNGRNLVAIVAVVGFVMSIALYIIARCTEAKILASLCIQSRNGKAIFPGRHRRGFA